MQQDGSVPGSPFAGRRPLAVKRVIEVEPQRVWNVLSDGWVYPSWVVGASRARAVTADWPRQGAKLHHSVGVWPLALDDHTEVMESVEGSRMVLQAKTRPAAVQVVELTLEPVDQGTRITMREDVMGGPGTLVPFPLRQAALLIRNREALRRLSWLAEAPEQP